ncbi:MAG: hypothetical protein WD077_00865 [Bacteroidia bacterium]
MELEDEKKGNLDGKILKSILDICQIPNTYFYLRTKKEFKHAIKEFQKSNFGFLHISCHGNEEGISTTFDYISFDLLEDIIQEKLSYRRLFLSACEAARFELAQRFIPKYHCYSVVGSPDSIYCDKAAVFWSTFYHLMYESNQKRMPQIEIMPTLANLTKVFKIKLNYYSIIKNSNPKSIDHLREIHYQSGDKEFDKVKSSGSKNIFRA